MSGGTDVNLLSLAVNGCTSLKIFYEVNIDLLTLIGTFCKIIFLLSEMQNNIRDC